MITSGETSGLIKCSDFQKTIEIAINSLKADFNNSDALIFGLQILYQDIIEAICVNDHIDIDKYNQLIVDIGNSMCLMS
jgi:hypothetical protein